MKLFILILFSLNAYSLEIRGLNEKSDKDCTHERTHAGGGKEFKRCGAITYYLIGSCEESAQEIKKMNPTATPKCECSNKECKTELNPHLNRNMQALLKSPHPHDNWLNCYNTLLHALGFNPGYYQSANDAEFLIASPYCKRREGRPKPGDVIWVTGHGYLALTDKIAFNKSAPGNDLPYEVIMVDDYFKNNQDDLSCQFISKDKARKKGCETTSSAYQCNIPEALKTHQVLGDSNQKLLREIDDCGYKSSVLGEKVETDFWKLSNDLTEIGRHVLSVPQESKAPKYITKVFRDAFLAAAPKGEDLKQVAQQYDNNSQHFLEHFYLMSLQQYCESI